MAPRRRDRRRPARAFAAAWLLALCFGTVLGTGGSDAARRLASSPQIRQLSAPFQPRDDLRRLAPRRSRRSIIAAHRMNARELFLARQTRLGTRSAAVRQRGPRRKNLMRRPPLARDVVVDQLLAVPRGDASDVERFNTVRALGVPIIPGVPPIAIIDPPRAERLPEHIIRRRAR
jgi:hypothetical protein